ncbi:MAG TPA: valine--tRNA ligase, partial [Syntrophomonas sp.]|nr:valine--tRNA ligase [Syntrophomonas sp.]
DPNDFEMGLRHNLEQVVVIDNHGQMNENAGRYQGMDRYECRRQIVADLKEQGFLIKIEDIKHAVGHCQRCDTIIAPLVSKQWFVRMKPLAEPAIEKVLNEEIRFVPERFTKIYINWMENIRDWCISRQLWWGHRIPVWYCQDCGEIICSKTDPDHCPSCRSSSLEQDEDVLDTWFSSALWPFSTLGWPESTTDLDYFYPTTVLVTGRDIIFFWVARMIFSGIEHTGKVPFYDVNIHGLILDGQGRKMSKSLGNGIDPIEVIEKYGADTLRFSLITGVTPGNDIRFHWEKVENTRNFANKIWNASRFVIMNLEGYEKIEINPNDYTLADRWIVSRLNQRAEEVNHLLERYDLGEAAKVLYDFIWDEFCDWYIELAKPRLSSSASKTEKLVTQNVLVETLTGILRLLHPFMPFITEEIYHYLPGHNETIMLDPWPVKNDEHIWESSLEEMQQIISIIRVLRNIRAEFNVSPGAQIKTVLVVNDDNYRKIISANQVYIKQMARVKEIEIVKKLDRKPAQAVSALTSQAEIYVPLEGVIDIDKEMARLKKDLKGAIDELARAEGKLNNQNFISRAPQEVIEKEKGKAEEARIRKEGILQRLEILKQA